MEAPSLDQRIEVVPFWLTKENMGVPYFRPQWRRIHFLECYFLWNTTHWEESKNSRISGLLLL
jgi:hypothetical protein